MEINIITNFEIKLKSSMMMSNGKETKKREIYINFPYHQIISQMVYTYYFIFFLLFCRWKIFQCNLSFLVTLEHIYVYSFLLQVYN